MMPVEVAVLEFVRRAELVAEALPPARDYLAQQLRRAASSAFLNLREGLGEFAPREKARFFRMSVRSIREADGCLILSVTLEPTTNPLVTAARHQASKAAPQIVRLITYQQKRQ